MAKKRRLAALELRASAFDLRLTALEAALEQFQPAAPTTRRSGLRGLRGPRGTDTIRGRIVAACQRPDGANKAELDAIVGRPVARSSLASIAAVRGLQVVDLPTGHYAMVPAQ